MVNDFKKFFLKIFNLCFSNLKKKNVDFEFCNLIILGCRLILIKIRIIFFLLNIVIDFICIK